MRLVDADAFIEENKDIIDCEIDHPKYQDTLRELINNAPTIERPQWIPCSKQLPSDAIHVDDMVLVCYENGSIRFNSFMDGQWVQGNPIAWMPLPKPYKGEGEAE